MPCLPVAAADANIAADIGDSAHGKLLNDVEVADIELLAGYPSLSILTWAYLSLTANCQSLLTPERMCLNLQSLHPMGPCFAMFSPQSVPMQLA